MIDGRPRESLVLYDNPIEVRSHIDLDQSFAVLRQSGGKIVSFTDEL